MIVMMTWDALNHPTIRIYYWFIVGFYCKNKTNMMDHILETISFEEISFCMLTHVL